MRFTRTALLLAALANVCGVAQAPKNPVGIDFSYAGYQAGARDIPFIPAVLSVQPTGGDDTALLQSAVDHVAALPIDANGFRGAVLLRPGRFRIRGQIHLNAGGIVLRGSGSGANGTALVAEGLDRRTLIQAGGSDAPALSPALDITDDTIEAGSRKLHLANTAGLDVGSRIVIRRPSTAAWIKAHGMSGLLGTFADQRLDWKPGSHDLLWDRTVTAIDASSGEIEFDAPITFRMERPDGAGIVSAVQSKAPLVSIGIEDLVLDSTYDSGNPKDEEHRWIAIALDHVEDAWVRSVTARHLLRPRSASIREPVASPSSTAASRRRSLKWAAIAASLRGLRAAGARLPLPQRIRA